MTDEKTPAEAEPKTDPTPAQPSEDDAMRAAGFRKVRGVWRR